MITRSKEGVRAIFGDDLRDIAAYLRSTPREWRERASETNSGGNSWDLNVGYQGAWRLADTGWSQGAADLHTAVQAIEPDAVLPELRFDMGGERVDVPRFLGGNPACMVSHGRQTRQRPVVHLVVDGCASGSVSAKAFAAYGAALTAVVDTIENSGRRVELDIVFGVDLGGWTTPKHGLVGWKVKRAEDHLDLSAVAFSVAHPAAFRRIGFALFERLPASWWCSGYGIPKTIKDSELELIGAEGAFILPGIGATATGLDPKKAIPLIIKQVNDKAGEEILSAA